MLHASILMTVCHVTKDMEEQPHPARTPLASDACQRALVPVTGFAAHLTCCHAAARPLTLLPRDLSRLKREIADTITAANEVRRTERRGPRAAGAAERMPPFAAEEAAAPVVECEAPDAEASGRQVSAVTMRGF
jgi:hypothetical protein